MTHSPDKIKLPTTIEIEKVPYHLKSVKWDESKGCDIDWLTPCTGHIALEGVFVAIINAIDMGS